MQNTILNLRESMRQARGAQEQPLYDEREIQSVTALLLDEVCGISRIDRVLHPDIELTAAQRETMLRIAVLLGQGIPVQQALGYEWFCGERFVVTPDVLVPRPETAELVNWIVGQATEGAVLPSVRILDVGTGSGCIAVTLARLINNSQVVALDLSTAALGIAHRNACQQGVDNVQFVQGDILKIVDNSSIECVIPEFSTAFPPTMQQNCPPSLSTAYPPMNNGNPPLFNIHKQWFDVIVSNPPYICRREAAEMSDIVLDHEPDMALFVPDEDPLLFYRAIARYACAHLCPGGWLYFEINAAYGSETCDLLRDLGFMDVELRQDVNGRDRMVRARQKY